MKSHARTIVVLLLPLAVDKNFDLFFDVLSQDEIEKGKRYVSDKDKNRFVIGRGALRHLLGALLDVPPTMIPIAYSQTGKPFLALPDNEWGNAEGQPEGVHFSVTHSGQFVGIAIARQIVGLDIEQHRELDDMDGLASRVFSEQELQTLRSLPIDERTKAFFSLWTRKEAFLKARGDGITASIREINIGLESLSKSEKERHTNEAEAYLRGWSIRDLHISDEYSAALATNSPDCEFEVFRDFDALRKNLIP